MSTAWSFAKISCMDVTLLNALSSQAIPKISEFDSLALSKMSWACAVFELIHPPLLASISSEALARISEFELQERLNILWAFADLSVGFSVSVIDQSMRGCT